MPASKKTKPEKPKRKRRRRRRSVVQLHHISYDPDWSVPVYQGEHYAITLLNRRKRVSLGAIISLKHFVAKWEHRAEHLKYPVES